MFYFVRLPVGSETRTAALIASPNHLTLIEKPVLVVATAGYRSLGLFSIPMFHFPLRHVGRGQSAVAASLGRPTTTWLSPRRGR